MISEKSHALAIQRIQRGDIRSGLAHAIPTAANCLAGERAMQGGQHMPSMGCGQKMQRGVTLIELAIVLVIIAILFSAVSSASSLIQIAGGQRLFTEHVIGWKNSYQSYVNITKAPPGDNPSTPTYLVNGAVGSPMCNDAGNPKLTNAMLAHGIEVPQGRGLGREDLAVYQDSNSVPHELKVCFASVPWSLPGASVGVFVNPTRNVMVLQGVSTELARQFDTLVDGTLDARFGKFRLASQASSLSTTGVDWPAVKSGSSDDDVQELTVFLLMD